MTHLGFSEFNSGDVWGRSYSGNPGEDRVTCQVAGNDKPDCHDNGNI